MADAHYRKYYKRARADGCSRDEAHEIAEAYTEEATNRTNTDAQHQPRRSSTYHSGDYYSGPQGLGYSTSRRDRGSDTALPRRFTSYQEEPSQYMGGTGSRRSRMPSMGSRVDSSATFEHFTHGCSMDYSRHFGNSDSGRIYSEYDGQPSYAPRYPDTGRHGSWQEDPSDEPCDSYGSARRHGRRPNGRSSHNDVPEEDYSGGYGGNGPRFKKGTGGSRSGFPNSSTSSSRCQPSRYDSSEPSYDNGDDFEPQQGSRRHGASSHSRSDPSSNPYSNISQTAAPQTDLYARLNVSRDVSSDGLRKAWQKLCLLNHPDKVVAKEQDEAKKAKVKSQATKKMADINRAYEVLKTPLLRKYYDQTGQFPSTQMEADLEKMARNGQL